MPTLNPNPRWVAALLCLALILPSPTYALRVETPIEAGAEERLSHRLNPAAGAEESQVPKVFKGYQYELVKRINRSKKNPYQIDLDEEGRIAGIYIVGKKRRAAGDQDRLLSFASLEEDPNNYRLLSYVLYPPKEPGLMLANVKTGKIVAVYPSGDTFTLREAVSPEIPEQQVQQAMRDLLEGIGRSGGIHSFWFHPIGTDARNGSVSYRLSSGEWIRMVVTDDAVMTSGVSTPAKFKWEIGKFPDGKSLSLRIRKGNVGGFVGWNAKIFDESRSVGKVLVFFGSSQGGEDALEVVDLRIVKDADTGRGIGTRVIKVLIHEAMRRGLTRFVGEVNNPRLLRILYKSGLLQGAKVTAREDGPDAQPIPLEDFYVQRNVEQMPAKPGSVSWTVSGQLAPPAAGAEELLRVEQKLGVVAEAMPGGQALAVQASVLGGRPGLKKFLSRLPQQAGLETITLEGDEPADWGVALAGLKAERVVFLGEQRAGELLRRILPEMQITVLSPGAGLEQVLWSLGIPADLLEGINASGVEERLTRERAA